jgi:hypothetical protein
MRAASRSAHVYVIPEIGDYYAVHIVYTIFMSGMMEAATIRSVGSFQLAQMIAA